MKRTITLLGDTNMKQSPTTVKMNQTQKRKKILLVIFWGLILSLNTWTDNLDKMLEFRSIGFRWVTSPNFRSFFYVYDITRVHHDFITVKLGHFFGFAIMDFLIFKLLNKHKESILVSITFAFFTEFFQLFFGRDGRLYDLIIDTLGVLMVYLIMTVRKARSVIHLDQQKR
jgi:hypothetical protein